MVSVWFSFGFWFGRPKPKGKPLPVALFGAENISRQLGLSPFFVLSSKAFRFRFGGKPFTWSPGSFRCVDWFTSRFHRPFSLGYRTTRSPGVAV
jgi:hypothetical protein